MTSNRVDPERPGSLITSQLTNGRQVPAGGKMLRMNGIQAIILDVDGIIVGEKIGFNSPHPHPDVIAVLKKVRDSGIPICLCTAKPHFSIQKEITDANLHNIHITDGGALIIDPIDEVIAQQHIIDKDVASAILQKFVDDGVYVEFYDQSGYYVQRDQVNDITPQHTHILQVEPILVEDIVAASKKHNVTKIMPIVTGESGKEHIEDTCRTFNGKILLSWGVHPIALPLQFGIITTKGISKQQGAKDISTDLGIPLENILGVGDSLSDWQFLELCGYAATLQNGNEELKQRVLSKDNERSFIGPSVDDNGIVQVLKHFKLTLSVSGAQII